MNSKDVALEREALVLAGKMGEKALPLLKKMLKNQRLDQSIKDDIQAVIKNIETEQTLRKDSA